MNFLPVRGTSPFHEKPSQECLGEWCCSKQRIVIYRSGKKALSAIVEDKLGNITRVPPEHIHGGMNRELSSHKLIKMMKELPKRQITLVLSDLPNLEIELHVFLTLQAAGHDEEKQLEYTRKLIEKARSCSQHQEAVGLYRDALDRFRSAILELDKKKEDSSTIKRELQQIENEFFYNQRSMFIQDYLCFQNDKEEFTRRLSMNSNSKNLLDDLLSLAERTTIRPPSICDHFTYAYIAEIRGGKLLSAEHYLMLAEAYSKVSQFPTSVYCLRQAISLVKSLNNVFIAAHFFEHIDHGWLSELCQKTKSRECEQWLLEKDAVRMTFESHLVSLKTLSKRQRPTCFVCFSLEEDVKRWLLKALLPDLHLLGVKPLCSSTDLNPGMRLEAFQDFIKYAEKVIIICTPELQRKCKERGMDRDGGSACEIALILARCYGVQKLDEKGIIPLFLKGDRKSSLPVNFLEDIFGTKLNDRDPGILAYNGENQEICILSYYGNAFRLFGSILDIDAGASDGIKCSFNAVLENIFRGTIDEKQVQEWKSKKQSFAVPLDQISIEEALVHTASSCELVNRFLCTFQTRLNHYPQMVQALEYYIDLNATTAYRGNQLEDLGDRLKRFLEGTKTFMLIQGDTGSGKSTFVHHLTKNLLGRYRLNTSGVIPILIELKEISCNSEKKVENFFERYLKERIGLTDKDIALLKTVPTVIFFDGFDEASWEPCNLFRLNQLEGWHCKVVVTCRHQFLLNRDYHSWFCLHHEFYKECDELFVAPFSHLQISSYLRNFKPLERIWSLEQYQAAIENQQIKDLVENPLMLRMVVEVLPDVNLTERVTRYGIYSSFIKKWFDREDNRLKALQGVQAKLKGLPPQEAFFRFCMRLSMQMCRRGFSEVEYHQMPKEIDEFSLGLVQEDQVELKQWEEFFSETDEEIKKTLGGCPLRGSNRRYSFYHRSLLEFFVAAYMYKTLHLDTTNPQVSKTVVDNLGLLPINQCFLSRESAVIEFLAEKITGQTGPIECLMQVVMASKNRPKLSCAASNAITILNVARVPFSGRDFSCVQIPRANLDYVNFDHCDLSCASLEGGTLRDGWLSHANFNRANLKNVSFGERPSFYLKGRIEFLSFHPASGNLVIATEKRFLVIDPFNQSKIFVLSKKILYVSALLRGELFAIVDESGYLQLWHAVDKKLAPKILSFQALSSAFAARPDGKMVAFGTFSFEIWDIEKEQLTDKIEIDCDGIFNLEFSPDNQKLLVGGNDGIIRMWSLSEKKFIREFDAGEKRGKLTYLMHRPDGKEFASAYSDGSLITWDFERNEPNLLHVSRRPIATFAYNRDGSKLAAGDAEGGIIVWDMNKRLPVASFQGHKEEISSLAFSSDTEILTSGSSDGYVRCWLLDNLRLGTLDSLENLGEMVDIAYDTNTQEFLTLAENGSIFLGQPRKVSKKEYLPVPSHSLKKLFCVDKKIKLITVESDNNGTLNIWDVGSKKNENTMISLGWWIRYLALRKDGKQAVGLSMDGRVMLWNLFGPETVGCPLKINFQSICLVYSPEGSHLGLGTLRGKIGVYSFKDGSLINLGAHRDRVSCLVFSPDNRMLCSGSIDHQIKLWDLQKKCMVACLKDHQDQVTCLAYSPSGQILASGSYDMSLKLWDVGQKTCQLTLKLIDVPLDIIFGDEDQFAIRFSYGIHTYKKNCVDNSWQLKWANKTDFLIADQADFKEAVDLSIQNRLLLSQRGAVVDVDKTSSCLV